MFHIGKNASVDYYENHFAKGDGAKKVIDPTTKIRIDKGGKMFIHTAQIGGVDFSQWFYVLGGGVPGAVYETVAQAQAAGATTLNIGVFLNSVISFFITMFAIFLFVRTMNKMRDKKPANTRACPYCKSTINNAATKCPGMSTSGNTSIWRSAA